MSSDALKTLRLLSALNFFFSRLPIVLTASESPFLYANDFYTINENVLFEIHEFSLGSFGLVLGTVVANCRIRVLEVIS